MKFERVSNYPDAVIPTRATKGSAGYDFTVVEDTVCPAWQVTYVPTGIKMQIDEGYDLRLSIRSSSPKKYKVILANGVGIVDSDYYNNPDNEGHIMFAILPFVNDVTFKKGERIGQGVIEKYGLTDDDMVENVRTGGFGSTNQVLDLLFNTSTEEIQHLSEVLNGANE